LPLLLLLLSFLCLQAQVNFLPPAVFQCDKPACVSTDAAAAAAAAAAVVAIPVLAGTGQVPASRSVQV
jgi:hypothetical protein